VASSVGAKDIVIQTSKQRGFSDVLANGTSIFRIPNYHIPSEFVRKR
jgi:hypothetical protein